ncbi:FAD-dependent oxidoreductase [Rhodobacteraceae bacterium KMM 6894]|nr:FAD-dependent oxidoreductase [Rhodobacteraceae bacterium KMM 6894]
MMETQQLPPSADVVVIGGGIVGCALAWHLAEIGAGSVVLVERDRLGCGTTWHSAANISFHEVSTRAGIETYHYSQEMFARLEEETGQKVGWTETGRVQIATNTDRLASLRHVSACGRANGIAAEMIGPDEISDRLPLLNVSDVLGGLWTPDAGRVNATDLLNAYAIGARHRGARIIEGAPVIAIDRDAMGVTAVVTESGRIATRTVINAAGLWSPTISALCGLGLPIHATEHFYILTKPFAGICTNMPAFRDADALIYGRDEVGGLLLGCFERRVKPLPLSALPERFSFDLLPEDWDQFEPYMIAALHRIPSLADAEVKMLLNGPESFTTDGRYLLGPQREVPGLYVAAGMNSAGVTDSAGAARALAEIIVHGASKVDVSPFDPGRFAGFHSSPGWLSERIAEAPSYVYGRGRVAKDFETGRDLRLSPFHNELSAAGAEFRSVMGWERASHVVQQGESSADVLTRVCRWREESVALVDATALGRRIVNLQDFALRYAAWSPNVADIDLGDCVVVEASDKEGRGLGRAHIIGLGGSAALIVTEAERAALDTTLFAGLPDWGPTGRLAEAGLAQLLLFGPRAAEALAKWITTPIALGKGTPIDMDGADGIVSRLPDSGALLVTLPADTARAGWRKIASAVEAVGGGISGWSIAEIDRIARMIPSAGREITPTVPLAANGAPAPHQRLIAVSCALPLMGGEPVWRGKNPVGLITSVTALPDRSRIAIALVSGPEGEFVADFEGNCAVLIPRMAESVLSL